jgi:prepilin-type processing-associated H-X9-DG protein
MKITPQREGAFTVLDLLVTIVVLMVLATILLPVLSGRPTGCRINCTNNLKQIGLSFKIWALDNGDRWPMDVPAADGGAKEATSKAIPFPIFQVMSNELSTPRVLVCPEDSARQAAINFGAGFADTNLSYFVCQNPADSGTPGILLGDRNLTNQLIPGKRYIAFTRELTLGWTKEMHSKKGNVGFGDGSVAQFPNGALSIRRQGRAVLTNRLLVP